jgi:hypothetical protein
MTHGLLHRRTPTWKRDIAARTPEGWYGLATPRGWDPIVRELHQQLVAIDPKYQVYQIKEKFGELRYYCSLRGDTKTKAVQDLMTAAAMQASTSCQVCGSPGVLSEKPGPVRVLCSTHDQQENCTNGYDLRPYLRSHRLRSLLARRH